MPANSRVTRRVVKFVASDWPRTNSVQPDIPSKNAGLRPSSSDPGPQMIGPIDEYL